MFEKDEEFLAFESSPTNFEEDHYPSPTTPKPLI
jgi:hypothetical protein